MEKKFLFKWILKLKVDVNSILFIQQKVLSVSVQRARSELGLLGHLPATGHTRFGGPAVWATLAVNSDQPKGPEENKRLPNKMNILFILIFLFSIFFFLSIQVVPMRKIGCWPSLLLLCSLALVLV